MNYQTILTKLEHWKQKDDELQSTFTAFFKKIAPDCYPPYFEFSQTTAFLDSFDDEMKEWLGYYIFEAPGMEKSATITSKGIQYDAKDRNQFIEFLETLDKKKPKE